MAKKSEVSRDRVYKRIELVGVSGKGVEPAIESAIARASETVTDLRWFEVKEIRGAISEGKVTEYQVVLSVGFEVK